jgi:hypothetical protein
VIGTIRIRFSNEDDIRLKPHTIEIDIDTLDDAKAILYIFSEMDDRYDDKEKYRKALLDMGIPESELDN